MAVASAYDNFSLFYSRVYPILFENSRPRKVSLSSSYSVELEHFQFLNSYLRIMVNDDSIFHIFKIIGEYYGISFKHDLSIERIDYEQKFRKNFIT